MGKNKLDIWTYFQCILFVFWIKLITIWKSQMVCKIQFFKSIFSQRGHGPPGNVNKSHWLKFNETDTSYVFLCSYFLNYNLAQNCCPPSLPPPKKKHTHTPFINDPHSQYLLKFSNRNVNQLNWATLFEFHTLCINTAKYNLTGTKRYRRAN